MTARSDLCNSVCLATILANARTWYRKDYGRPFVRDKDTEKHMVSKLKKELNALWASQRAEWDDALTAWYERMVVRYGGSVEALPWHS